jgi:hypothetical protein
MCLAWIQCVSRCALWIAFPTGSKVPGSEEVSARQLRVATVSAAVKTLTRFLGDLLYFLTGEGSWSLRPHERVVIEAVIDTLPEHAQALLHSQLNGTTFVQRSHKQISRPRFYTAPYLRDRRAIEGGEYSHEVIDVLVDVDGVNEVAQVEFFRERVDSIQFKRPAAYYVGKRLRVTGTRPGKPTRSHAAAIDRREHGTER